MKLFTETLGTFQMYIPLNWEYKNPSIYKDVTAPHSFGNYEKHGGAFQLSCKKVDEHISKLISDKGLLIQDPSVTKIEFSETIFQSDNLHSYMWTAAIEDHFFLVTYIFNPEEVQWYEEELIEVRKILSTIKYVKLQYRNEVSALRRFDYFMTSIATTIDLKNKAMGNGSFLEVVALTATHIDALLRVSIILKNQIENNNKEIDKTILFQDASDKPVMEREIYKRVLDRGIITKDIYDELEFLYKERNKVIHRYIITEIRTEDVFEISVKYIDLEDKIGDIVNSLEQEQFRLKVGIYGIDEPPDRPINDDEMKRLRSQIKDKHGAIRWPDKKEFGSKD